MRKALRREWHRLSQQVPEWKGVQLVEIEELSNDAVTVSGQPAPFEYRRARLKHGGAYRPCRAYRLVFSDVEGGSKWRRGAAEFGGARLLRYSKVVSRDECGRFD